VGQQKIISAQENGNGIFFVSNYAYLNKSAEMLIVMQQRFKFELILVTAVIVNEGRGSRTQF
jgi:hypothetical protein